MIAHPSLPWRRRRPGGDEPRRRGRRGPAARQGRPLLPPGASAATPGACAARRSAQSRCRVQGV